MNFALLFSELLLARAWIPRRELECSCATTEMCVWELGFLLAPDDNDNDNGDDNNGDEPLFMLFAWLTNWGHSKDSVEIKLLK